MPAPRALPIPQAEPPAPAPAAPLPSRPRLLALATAATALCLYASARWGPGSSPDSASYVIAAYDISSGAFPAQVDGRPFASWPPLFPALMAGAHRLGASPVEAGRWINALCFGGIVAGSAGLAARRGRLAGALVALMLLGMPGLARVCATLWSEPLMVACFVGSLWRVGGASAGLLLGAGALARHLGAVSIVAVVPGWIAAAGRDKIAAARTGALALALAVAGPAAWSLALRLAGVSRPRADSAIGVWTNTCDLARSFGAAALHTGVADGASGAALWALAMVSGACSLRRGIQPFVLICFCYLAIYPLAAILGASATVVAILGLRFAAPMLPPAAILLAEGAAMLSGRARYAALAVALGWAVIGVDQSIGLHDRGVGGISAPGWQRSGWPDHVSAALYGRTDPLTSNRPDLLALRWGVPVALAAQIHPFRRPHAATDDLDRLRARLEGGPVYLAWFSKSPGQDWYFYTPDRLREAGLTVEPVVPSAEGVLYRITAP